jgi:hypothetical protein
VGWTPMADGPRGRARCRKDSVLTAMLGGRDRRGPLRGGEEVVVGRENTRERPSTSSKAGEMFCVGASSGVPLNPI